jgi:hypothetical protein
MDTAVFQLSLNQWALPVPVCTGVHMLCIRAHTGTVIIGLALTKWSVLALDLFHRSSIINYLAYEVYEVFDSFGREH